MWSAKATVDTQQLLLLLINYIVFIFSVIKELHHE